MNVTCPSCETVYRVDPSKVPAGGVRARCAVCSNVFPVNASAGAGGAVAARPMAPASPPPPPQAGPPPGPAPSRAARAPVAPAAPAAPAPPAAPAGATPGRMTGPLRPVNPFMVQDPKQKARRLARALVSDLVVYHPEKR